MMSSIASVNAQSGSEVIVAAEEITLTVDFGNGTTLEFSNLNGSNVLDVTSEVLNVQVQWYGPLAYIRGIEGVVGQGEYGWQYWVNGEFASAAVNLYSLDNGDAVSWVYSSPVSATQQDPTFIPGMILITASGLGFIAIVFVQTTRRIR
ncbi:MAG: DUF4430 domain-containing protein [Candidatus Thorarchaeota archaeon]